MSNVIKIKIRHQKHLPDNVSVAFDMGQWGVVFRKGPRFCFRRCFGTEAEAWAEAERLARDGKFFLLGRRA